MGVAFLSLSLKAMGGAGRKSKRVIVCMCVCQLITQRRCRNQNNTQGPLISYIPKHEQYGVQPEAEDEDNDDHVLGGDHAMAQVAAGEKRGGGGGRAAAVAAPVVAAVIVVVKVVDFLVGGGVGGVGGHYHPTQLGRSAAHDLESDEAKEKLGN